MLVVGTPETVAEHPTSHTGRYRNQIVFGYQWFLSATDLIYSVLLCQFRI